MVRERAIKFLSTKLKSVSEDDFTPDVEEFLVTEAKKVITCVSVCMDFTCMCTWLRGLFFKTGHLIFGFQDTMEI